MMDVGRHPNIELLTYAEVLDVSGYVGNFKARIRKKFEAVGGNPIDTVHGIGYRIAEL